MRLSIRDAQIYLVFGIEWEDFTKEGNFSDLLSKVNFIISAMILALSDDLFNDKSAIVFSNSSILKSLII